MVLKLMHQLEILGLEESRRRAQDEVATSQEKDRLTRRVEVAHELMSALPASEDLPFCIQVCAKSPCPTAALLTTVPFGTDSPDVSR